MIQGFKLSEDLVRFETGFDDWKDAIRVSAQTLVKEDYMTEDYVDAMIESVVEHGPYIVIAPNIAMPHARPEKGAKKVGFSITVCDQPVKFEDDPQFHARLLVTLSCVDANTHLEMMMALVNVLGDDTQVDTILNTRDKQIILDLFNQEDSKDA